MSQKTKSEQAFEDYCAAVGIAWTRLDSKAAIAHRSVSSSGRRTRTERR